jgi:enterochelin esterase-like enzyme
MGDLEINRIISFALICLSLGMANFGTPAAADVRLNNSIASDVLGHPVRYAIYLPPGYDEDDRSYPVLYLLHGGGTGQPSDWFALAGLDQILDRLIKEGKIRPFIAIAPDGRRDQANNVATYFLNDHDGTYSWEKMFFEDFIPAVEARHKAIGNGDARAILGISMGALAGIVYQLRAPDTFAGVAALSSAFRTEQQVLDLSAADFDSRYAGVLGRNLEGQARLNAAWSAISAETLLSTTENARFSRVPRLYFDIGADDPFFEGTADLHIALRNAGIRHHFRVNDGGHDWIFWRGTLERAILHIDAVLTRGYGE